VPSPRHGDGVDGPVGVHRGPPDARGRGRGREQQGECLVLELVERLDLSRIEARLNAKDPRGTAPYDPRMMVALLLYAYAVGTFSSRKIERATQEDVAFRVLTADQHPDHDTSPPSAARTSPSSRSCSCRSSASPGRWAS
jgi:hypothetical protein